MSATSLGGEQRDPDELETKSGVSFSEYEAARKNDEHEPGTCCANCADFIPDKNGDGYGACAEVDGYIDRGAWCDKYEDLPEPTVPEDMSKEELATADVPDEYRTATSIGDETRDPEGLHTQDEVGLMESVEAIANGPAAPGESCGNCADFIPDKNSDTWGACAEVAGYIAVEDWCQKWQHVGE